MTCVKIDTQIQCRSIDMTSGVSEVISWGGGAINSESEKIKLMGCANSQKKSVSQKCNRSKRTPHRPNTIRKTYLSRHHRPKNKKNC